MELRERNRAATRVCFARVPPEADLATLGARDRWLLYRSMVRARLSDMVKNALPRTAATLGDDGLPDWLGRFFDERPPRTRYIREVPADFAAWAIPLFPATPGLPAWIVDLARYEDARWRARWVEADEKPPADDFAFDRIPLVNPTAVLLHLEWAVADKGVEERPEPEQRGCHVVVYRNLADQKAGAWVLNDSAAAIFERFLRGDETVADSVRSARGGAITQKFIESLSGLLADFLERTILLGAKPSQ